MTPKEKIQSLLSQALSQPVAGDGDIIRADEPAWNSLVHMELIFMVEDEFGIEFEADEIAGLGTQSQIIARVEALTHAA